MKINFIQIILIYKVLITLNCIYCTYCMRLAQPVYFHGLMGRNTRTGNFHYGIIAIKHHFWEYLLRSFAHYAYLQKHETEEELEGGKAAKKRKTTGIAIPNNEKFLCKGFRKHVPYQRASTFAKTK